MPNRKSSLPPAPDKMEAHVKEVFPIDIAPEEFAAKDGSGWMDFTFNDFRFKDPELDSWIHAVGKIIRDPTQLDEVRRKYLTDLEMAELRTSIAEDIDEGDEKLR